MSFSKGEMIFAEGDASDAVFIVQTGLVTLSAKLQGDKAASRETIIEIVSEKDFLGKDSIAGSLLRTETARALTHCRLLRIGQRTLKRALAREVTLANRLCAALLARDLQYRQDLVDQRCNFSEKRLARLLLRLAQYNGQASPETKAARINHTVLAKMVGTTRSRVCHFLKKFEAAGFIDFAEGDRQPVVRQSLLGSYANSFRSFT